LAAALFSSPDVLLLDEPTNHLDIGTVIWLEDFLENYEKTLVVVSHDRHFLNYVCTDIMLIKDQQILYFRGNYDTYEKVFMEERLSYERERQSIQGQIDHLMIFINRFRVNANRAP
jgi:singapore isolate B (sub-type 7) whole genome shotgun sequence assembly, scaffold_20